MILVLRNLCFVYNLSLNLTVFFPTSVCTEQLIKPPAVADRGPTQALVVRSSSAVDSNMTLSVRLKFPASKHFCTKILQMPL